MLTIVYFTTVTESRENTQFSALLNAKQEDLSALFRGQELDANI
jgi:hypothetical protein